ncbi:X-Pro dipeptidyl-peptidase [Sphaerisporangium krabiense]|uniref:Xaa-Pro dipeptidyl-peptidase n=1 Tax=Sphaerisporangium krabiense TaxID=763782 RepID=A0A7W9DPD6_9ACTN|nr:Xaa-Pro dipeptidyl-peptidase [Sphaerisporangium krabiense]MBB5625225.1 X-Pro dipeptidyl-peptidase [Sphaerisporangium krabiense]GII64266.1 X-Pro dipeptidyl-peptidase [Sphaerisporangium krabiense]
MLWAVGVTLALTATTGGVASAQAAPAIDVVNGRTRPVFSYADAIREHVSVETAVDSDGDGRKDRANVDIIRPRETDRGLKVPAIIDDSPYYDSVGRGNESERKRYDDAGRPVKFPLFYDNYFVPRGYAVLLVDMVGTNRSDGCPDVGAAADIAAGTAVIDWLNGRARAYGADGAPVTARWATGRAGMIGKSYDGTLANAVAATGVKGLETIVPISAITSWYRYRRMNGVRYSDDYMPWLADLVDTDPPAKCAATRQVLHDGQDDATGNYNAFWDERNYLSGSLADVGKVRASVFAVHGIGDLNVKPDQFGTYWQALARRGVPRKLWLSQYGHVDPFDYKREEWIDALHGWFDRWLYKIDNDAARGPKADLQLASGQWVKLPDWPSRSLDVPLWLRPGEEGQGGGLGLRPAPQGSTLSFTDDPSQTEDRMVSDPTAASPNRLVFLTPPLKRAVRFSGTPVVDIRAKLDRTDANLTALVVDYGDDLRVDHYAPAGGIRTLAEESCHGDSTADDDGCYRRTETAMATRPLEIVARGWLDAGNRRSLTTTETLTPGKDYRFSWSTLPADYVVQPGHRLAVILAASDLTQTVPDQPAAATVTVDLAASKVWLPLASVEAVQDAAPPATLEFAPAPEQWRGPKDVVLPKQSRDFF